MRDFINKIRAAWSPSTCWPKGVQATLATGQCAVTALLVQDLLGGEILRAVVEVETGDGEYVEGHWSPKTREESHYWNYIPGIGEIDLTRDQYSLEQEIPRGEVVPRSRLLDGERARTARTQERYEEFRRRFFAIL